MKPHSCRGSGIRSLIRGAHYLCRRAAEIRAALERNADSITVSVALMPKLPREKNERSIQTVGDAAGPVGRPDGDGVGTDGGDRQSREQAEEVIASIEEEALGLATSSTSELPDDQGGSSMELLIGEAAGGDQRGEECGKEQRSGSGSEASRADLAAEAITATASGEDLLPGGKGAAPGSSGSRPASTGTRGEAPASCSRPPSAGTAEAVPGSGPGTASATVIRSESRPGTAADQPVGSQPSRTGSAAERTRSSPASTPPPPVKSGSHGASPPSGKSGAKGETKAEKGGGGKGSKKSKKGKKAKISTGPAPVQSQLRVGGPLAPFLPGGIREAPPELWALRDRRATEALVRLNPAGEHKVTVLGLTRVEWPGFCPAVIPLRPVPFTSTLHSSIHTHTLHSPSSLPSRLRPRRCRRRAVWTPGGR